MCPAPSRLILVCRRAAAADLLQQLSRTILAPNMEPIAINAGTAPSTSLPEPLRALLNLRLKAESALSAPALEQELAEGEAGPATAHVKQALETVLAKSEVWKSEATSKLSNDELARGEYIKGWSGARLAEFDGTAPHDMPNRLRDALGHYQQAATLLNLPEPPMLHEAPSVTRPKEGLAPLVLPEVSGWAGEMLAEWARTQTTLAFSSLLLSNDQVIDENSLAELLTIACRRNVQGEPLYRSSRVAPLMFSVRLCCSSIHSHRSHFRTLVH